MGASFDGSIDLKLKNMAYCSKCGKELQAGSKFCGYCGQPVYIANDSEMQNHHEQNIQSESAQSGFIGGLNDYMGNTQSVSLNWKDLFTSVFDRHTKEEAEEIFICGTAKTTPPLSMVSDTWPKPWLYSRVFLCFLITYVLLYICSVFFQNSNAYPGLIMIGALAVPFTTLILFMEVNAFRNISVYEVLKYFLIGGCASLVVTLFLFDLDIVDTDLSSTWGAMMVGVIEEVGKLVIVYALIKRLPNCNYILSALLVGACVGAGFAAFESAGYALSPMMLYANLLGRGEHISLAEMMDAVTSSIYLRGLLAPGGHVAWASISGAALILAKGKAPLTSQVFSSSRFWRIFLIPVVLHGLWDAPIFMNYLKLIGLIIFVWIVVLILINMGLDEVKRLKSKQI